MNISQGVQRVSELKTPCGPITDWIFERDNIILENLENTPCKKLCALLVVVAVCIYSI